MRARVFNPTKLTYISTIYDGNPDPKNFVGAKISKDWNKWWEAMCTEFKNMEDKKVWKVILYSNVPPKGSYLVIVGSLHRRTTVDTDL
jgi:hypothetical protein